MYVCMSYSPAFMCIRLTQRFGARLLVWISFCFCFAVISQICIISNAHSVKAQIETKIRKKKIEIKWKRLR